MSNLAGNSDDEISLIAAPRLIAGARPHRRTFYALINRMPAIFSHTLLRST